MNARRPLSAAAWTVPPPRLSRHAAKRAAERAARLAAVRTSLRLLGWMLLVVGGLLVATSLLEALCCVASPDVHPQPPEFFGVFVGMPMVGLAAIARTTAQLLATPTQ